MRGGFHTRTCSDCGRAFPTLTPRTRRCRRCEAEHEGDVEMVLAEQAWDAGKAYERQRIRRFLDPLLTDVIALCHPDRHPIERGTKATEVTQELLRIREHIRSVP